MIAKDPVVFRDLFTSFILDGPLPKAVLIDGKRYELMIVNDTKPQRVAVKGAHNLEGKNMVPCD